MYATRVIYENQHAYIVNITFLVMLLPVLRMRHNFTLLLLLRGNADDNDGAAAES